jgi:dTDP-D-glucose 4,6-dehydratase
MAQALVDRLLADESDEPLEIQRHYDRGFRDGMRYVNKVVTGAENTLEQLDKGQEPEPEQPEEDRWSYVDTTEVTT